MRHVFSLFYHRKSFRSPYLPYWFWLFVICIFSGCVGVAVSRGPWVEKVDSTEAMRTVLYYAERLEQEKRMHLEDSFITYDDQIYTFHLEFRTQHVLDIKRARELLVDTVEGFLERVNNNPLLVGQLFEYPLTADNLVLTIWPEVFYGKYVDERRVGLITLCDGIVNFYGWDSFDISEDFWHSRREYYFQARDTVRFQREGDEIYEEETAPPPSPLQDEQFILNPPFHNYRMKT